MPNLPVDDRTSTPPDYLFLLDEAPTEVLRPKPLPVGTYTCIVGPPRYDRSSRKGTELVEFILIPVEPGEDVDADSLEEIGGLDGKTIRATFYIVSAAIYRLDEFHQNCGLDLAKPPISEMSRRQRNDECVNAGVIALVKHESADDGSRYSKLARTLPMK
jgi:hypothetical protein